MLGIAQPVAVPPTAGAFAGLTLDAKDREALSACTSAKCAMRMTTGAIAELQRSGMAAADDVFRRMLLGELTNYIKNGNAAAVVLPPTFIPLPGFGLAPTVANTSRRSPMTFSL